MKAIRGIRTAQAAVAVNRHHRRSFSNNALARATKAPTPQFRLKKILVPTDFSEFSAKAVDYALAFAGHSHATLVLLHVVEPTIYPASDQMMPVVVYVDDLQRQRVRSSRKRLAQFSAERIAGRVPTRLLVGIGNPYEVITERAKSLGADLIIIPTHGHGGLRRFLLGSTAERVVRHAPCPVLIVRDREHECIITRDA